MPIGSEAPAALPLTLHDVVAHHAARAPHSIALAAPGRSPLSYGGLREEIEAVGAALNRLGIGRNDRVAIVLPDGPEMVVAFLAVASVATAAPLNPSYRTTEFEFYLADLEARAVLVPAGPDHPARAAARSLGLAVIAVAPRADGPAGRIELRGTPSSPAPRASTGPDDVAIVLHTSGSTARPKRVPMLQRACCVRSRYQAATSGLSPDDRCLNVMPLFHGHGLVAVTTASLVAGASVACAPGLVPAKFFDWIDECRPTWLSGNPAIYRAILEHAAGRQDVIARCPLRLVRSASFALSPALEADIQRVLGAPVLRAYSSTEMMLIAATPLPPHRSKPGSVGFPVGCEIAILGNAGSFVPPPRRGEIVVRGEGLMSGYEDDPEANAQAFHEGWYRTGDLGYLDEDGYLFVEGRLKEAINRGGEKILPAEVERTLARHPDVKEVAVFPVPDPTLGEEVAAAVVLRDGGLATPRELREFAEVTLADFKVPRRVLIVTELPTTATGKTQRFGLASHLGMTSAERARPATVPFVAPRAGIEEMLAGIACDLLDLERVGVDDDLFALGGHSLLAAQLVARIRMAVGVELTVVRLLETPSVAAIAGAVVERLAAAAEPGALARRVAELETTGE